jgi:hypothetical protein
MSDWDSRILEGREPFIISEDGQPFTDGDLVYNYYDMWPGHIEMDNTLQEELSEPGIRRSARKRDFWFYVVPENGQRTLLNGERICSMEYAARRGFKGAS